ncbi:MAG: LPP20 family lipoprotein [Candidatus Hatepunaea meridiana]|nr:LPP20 family lipoprotein [Candidatus Hatepunaea meridiana]
MKVSQLIPILFLWLTGFSQAAPPNWYTSGQHPEYTQDFYIIGISSGESYEEAIEKASAQIARQIEVKIESEINSVISSFTEDDQEHISSEFKSTGKSLTEVSLKGAEVSEKANIGNNYYVLMTIDKDKYSTGLLAELEQTRSEIRNQYDDAEILLKDGKIIQALQTLIETSESATRFQTQAILYTSISGKSYITDDIISGPAIISKVRKLIGKVKLEKVSGNDQSAQNGKLLREPLIVKASHKQKDGLTPIKNIRLYLKDEDNKVIERLHTDEEGIAKFWIYAVGEDMGKVRVGFDLQSIPKLFKRDFKDIQTTFKYNIVAIPPMKFSIDVEDEHGKQLELVEGLIAKSVQDAGHHVSDKAPFLLSGKISVDDVQKVDGLGGSQYLVKTELTLFIQAKNTSEKIGSITLTGKGMDKASEHKALQKSYKKLKVKKKEFTKTLASAADKLRPIRKKLSKEMLITGKKFYAENFYFLALVQLAQVTDGDAEVAEAEKLIAEIRNIIAKQGESEAQ